MTDSAKPDYRNPFLWVPSSYLAMGLIYVTVGSVANVMFKNMGMDNTRAAFWSSMLGFPYTFKFLWAPLLELYKTKKFFVVLMQFLLAASIVGVAFALRLPGKTWLVPVLALLALCAILGATQDIGSDGVYVTTLPPKDLAQYTGFQSMCWNAGFLLAAGPLIQFSGVLHEQHRQLGPVRGWSSCWSSRRSWWWPGCITAACCRRARRPPTRRRASAEAMRTFGHAFVDLLPEEGRLAA